MAKEVVIHLVRHGEVHNPEGVLYGRLPGYHLSNRGREMADVVADYLADSVVTHLRSSPLERAQETLAPIAESFPELTSELDARLIESDNLLQGQVFGSTNKAVKNPANWWLFRNPLRPSWGEPYEQIAHRMHGAILDAVHATEPDTAAVLVSHQNPIWTVRRFLEGKPLPTLPGKRECTLGSLTSLTFSGDHLVAIDYAEPAKALLGPDANAAFSSGSN